MPDANPSNKSWYLPLLACPDCKAELSVGDRCVSCESCGFRRESGHKLDLRPDNPMPTRLPMLPQAPDCNAVLKIVDTNPPLETYRGPAATRNSTGFMSELSRILPRGARVLDLGCGPRDQAVPIEYLGFKYVGFDVSGDAVDFHGDAHAIPFADSVFDCVFTYAVLEHLHNPWLALSEIERVLKPGGVLIGSVSQGEPFHDSYCHLTSWGVISLVRGLPSMELRKLWGTGDTLWSLATIGRYPKVVKWLIRAVDWVHLKFPILAPRRARWTSCEKRLDSMHRAGSIVFLVEKAVDETGS
jgi:SAM-dependent methyltransferase